MGGTVIGKETTYNSPYVGSETIQAGKRFVLADSDFRINGNTSDNPRQIIADVFKMKLGTLVVDDIHSKTQTSDSFTTKTAKITQELTANEIFADTIKTNKLFLENVSGLNLKAAEKLTTLDLVVGGSAKIERDVSILGRGLNGAALTVNGGQIVANKGIISNTRNNRFQCLEIVGSGTEHDQCFKVDRYVDSIFEGDVTIQNSKLILDESKLVSDNITVTSFNEIKADEPISGVQLTTTGGWDAYQDEMVKFVDVADKPSNDAIDYDPYEAVQEAIDRNQRNYESINETVKSLTDPITYMIERNNPNVPKRFGVKNGVYRIDSSGNALFRNLVSETGKFSKIDAYKFNVNNLEVDKLLTTSVASNVVDTDNLLKSRGIAEFDGVVNSSADIFIENNSKVNVADGAEITIQNGAALVVKNGARFEMGAGTTVKMGGDVEMDLSKLVFVDSNTGRKFRISFRDAHECEGDGVVMEYEEVKESDTSETRAVEQTRLDARELDKKLKSLGV